MGNIYLVGLMGSGKTTIGRALAKKLNRKFIDSDHEIEARTGVTISTIFEIEGEPSFRQREAEVIRELTELDGIVLATGGGAILSPETRQFLSKTGTVIYLHSTVSQILQRTRNDRSRPLLRTSDPRKKLEELERQRDPLYREIANLLIETGRPNLNQITNFILDQLNSDSKLKLGNSKSGEHMSAQARVPYSIPNARQLNVDLDERSYPIYIGAKVLDSVGKVLEDLKVERAMIVTNTRVGPLYAAGVRNVLDLSSIQSDIVELPDGESFKTWETLNLIFDALLEKRCDRKTCVIALGGGVVGDMAGFASACFMRGVPFIQIPTTLLAQVDSSVGGKTGINHPSGKNMIGAFYQPQAVLADVETLNTLDSRELSAGLAEIIKHAAIWDLEYLAFLEVNIDALLARDPEKLSEAIVRSCQIKAGVVGQDEKESGLRAILNFGHTFGHAIESGLGYGNWLHGEAVGCGMILAAELSVRLGYISRADKERLARLIEQAKLPVIAPNLGFDTWVNLMAMDKKNERGMIKFVVLRALGKAAIESVPESILRDTIEACVERK